MTDNRTTEKKNGPLLSGTFEASQMQAQIDELNKKLQDLKQEHMCEMMRNEQDVLAYHMGMTEVIDVEPIDPGSERKE